MSDLRLRRYSNQAPETQLNGAISASATSLTVVTSNGFPSAPFTIECEGEIMLVTDVAGLVFTVQRAYDGSIPAAIHPDASTIKHVLTADDFDHQSREVIHSPLWGTHDDEFDDSTNSLTKVLPSGTATFTEAYGVHSALFTGQSTNDVVGSVKSIATLGVSLGVQTSIRAMAASNYVYAGPVFSSGSTTTDSVVWLHAIITSSGNISVALRSGTFTNVSTSHFSFAVSPLLADRLHMRLNWVGVNQYRGWFSIDGVSWTDFGQGVFVILGINPPTRFGAGVSSWGTSGDKLAAFDYLRIIEI